jgi:hypothetical protein
VHLVVCDPGNERTPELERRGIELDWHQLGKTPRNGGDPFCACLEERFRVHGFVDDLENLLRRGDVSVIPYPFDTVGRVKFAVGAGYGWVNVAYDETFACTKDQRILGIAIDPNGGGLACAS